MVAGQGGAATAAAEAAPISEVVDPAAEALRLGASPEVIVDSIKAASTAGRVIVNKVRPPNPLGRLTTGSLNDATSMIDGPKRIWRGQHAVV